MTALRSTKYLAGSRGAPCTLRIAGVCRDERDTVVPCHVRDSHTGRSIKASDLSVVDGCHRCHEVFDGRARLPSGRGLTEEEWSFYALRGLQETLERRREIGLLFVPETVRQEPKAKPRKARADRKPIPKRQPEWPQGRKLVSRPTFQKAKP